MRNLRLKRSAECFITRLTPQDAASHSLFEFCREIGETKDAGTR